MYHFVKLVYGRIDYFKNYCIFKKNKLNLQYSHDKHLHIDFPSLVFFAGDLKYKLRKIKEKRKKILNFFIVYYISLLYVHFISIRMQAIGS